MSIFKGDRLVAGRIGAKDYVRNQVLLDYDHNEYMLLNGITTAAKAVEMPYDGILTAYASFNTIRRVIILDKNKVQRTAYTFNANETTSSGCQIHFKKGEYIYWSGGTAFNATTMKLFFFRKRDYRWR